jgi:hypothetical protein
MAFLKLGSAQSSLYENYEKVNTTALDRQVNYAIDTVRLGIVSDKSDKTGKYMNPATYDNAIASLRNLLNKPMSAAKKQDILTMIENYQVSRNSLQGSIDKVKEGNKKSVSQIINEIKNQRQNETDMTKAALLGVAKSPADYAKKMSEIVMGTDEDGQLSGTMMDVEKAIADQQADKGYIPYELVNYRDELQQDFNKWRKVSEDPNIRSQYGLFIKPNNYGEWDSVDMLNINEAPKSGYKAVANANLDGMPVYLQHGTADADGFVSTTLPDGTILKTDSDFFDAPAGYDGTQLLGGKAIDYHPQVGDFVRVDGKDVYVFGGLNGSTGKLQHVTTPELMTKFNLWEKMNQSGGPRRDFTKDEFAQYAEIVGEPITPDYVNKSNQQALNDSLKAQSENWQQYLPTIPEALGATARSFTKYGPAAPVVEGAKMAWNAISPETKSLAKETLKPSSLGQAVVTSGKAIGEGAKTIGQTAVDIFKSVPKWASGFVKGFKGQ